MAEKKYVGGGWTGKYGLSLSLNLEKMKSLRVDKYGNIRISVGARREVDPKSKQTHYAAEDDWFWTKQDEKSGGSSDSEMPF